MSEHDTPMGRRYRHATFVFVGAIAIVFSMTAARAEPMSPAPNGAEFVAPAFVRLNSGNTSIRPFRIHATDEALADLRRPITTTKWPQRETVTDTSQGVQLATMQKLAHYWATDYDLRKVEARLNTLPQFTSNIDGVDIHFIHVRSKHPNALPVIITHGWPGSVIEQLKIIDPLTDPTAHRGRAEDAFDIVVPSLPGYGFSGQPTTTGWDPQHIARAWVELMRRLGYTRFVAQGGDWGDAVSKQMALQAVPMALITTTCVRATTDMTVTFRKVEG